MKRRLLTTLLLVLISFSAINYVSFLIRPVSASSSITLDGLTVVSGNITRLDDYEITMKGDILVEENGVLILKNTTIKIYQTTPNQHGVIIRGRLEATSSSKIIPDSFRPLSYEMTIQGKGSASLTDFELMGDAKKKAECHLIVEDSAVLVGVNLNITEGRITAQGSSVIKLSRSKIGTPSLKVPLTLYDSCDVSLSQVSAVAAAPRSAFELYNSSILSLSNCISPYSISGVIRAYHSSRVTVRDSSIEWHIETHNSSSALIISGEMKTVKAFSSSTISIIKASLTELNMYDSSIVLVQSARATGLFAYGKSRLTVIDSMIEFPPSVASGGTIGAYNSSDVSLTNSKVRVVSAYQSSTISISNSTVVWMARTSSSSVLSITTSKVGSLSVNDLSSVVSRNSMITLLEVKDFSKISTVDSVIQELTIRFKSVNASFSSLEPAFYSQWNSIVNGTLVASSSGYRPDITLTRTWINQSLSLYFFGASNITLIDSRIKFLSVYDFTVVQLVNSTFSAYEIMAEAKVYTYWYLSVFASNGTSVTVFYTNGTEVVPTVVVDGGLAKFPLLEKIVNASTTYAVGNYTLSAVWDGGSEHRTLEMTGNRVADLTPTTPWWQQNLYVIIIAVISVSVIISAISLLYILKKRKR